MDLLKKPLLTWVVYITSCLLFIGAYDLIDLWTFIGLPAESRPIFSNAIISVTYVTVVFILRLFSKNKFIGSVYIFLIWFSISFGVYHITLVDFASGLFDIPDVVTKFVFYLCIAISVITALINYFSPNSFLHNDRGYRINENSPLKEAIPHKEGVIKCPGCNFIMHISNDSVWDGDRHDRCGQRIILAKKTQHE